MLDCCSLNEHLEGGSGLGFTGAAVQEAVRLHYSDGALFCTHLTESGGEKRCAAARWEKYNTFWTISVRADYQSAVYRALTATPSREDTHTSK